MPPDHFSRRMNPVTNLVPQKRRFVIWPLFKFFLYGCQITFRWKKSDSWSFWWSNLFRNSSQSRDIFWCNLTPLIVMWQVSCYISMIEEIPRINLRPNTPTQDQPTQRYRRLKFDPFLFWSIWVTGIRFQVETLTIYWRRLLRLFWYIVCGVYLSRYDL